MDSSHFLQTEQAISRVKSVFTEQLAAHLHLTPVSSPLVVLHNTGLNDDLSGAERPVTFPIKALAEQQAVVVHSLAKWKRMRLKKFNIPTSNGILTDMKALRPDEDYSPIHSIYVDQWDWEQRIAPADRTVAYLKNTVTKIYTALKTTEQQLAKIYPELAAVLPQRITFIHTEELLQRYPDLSPKERENQATKTHGAIFLIGIGHALSNGLPHDNRSADYDDWSTPTGADHYGLNGDIIFWNPILNCAFEISSMGIRVNASALKHQLTLKGCQEKASLPYHSALLADNLPECIGGGIGQSRLCMFMLKKQHIGEVQVSIWADEEEKRLAGAGINLL